MIKKTITTILFASCIIFNSYSQAGTPSDTSLSVKTNFAEMSLEELMNVKVVSASKKSESAFDAPLSISSVSREEIKKAGSTSIMEALRLVPGLIVREVTAGNYQVDIRGFDNLPYLSQLNSASNSITLVMIDNRPVYNYFNGGTFWETLPVDLNDVDKIEVVRGPASALYGPNAAAGVVNIITRKADKKGLYTVANAQGGTPGAVISNASVGYKFNKFDFIVSGNQQYRLRTETDYYSWVTGNKESKEDVHALYAPTSPLQDLNGNNNINQRYPHPNVALNKYGYNAFLNYNLSPKASIGLTLGGQNSQNQKAFIDNLATPLTTAESNTQYADLKAKINGLSAQVSYNGGLQNASLGFYGYKYDFKTVDAFLEYDLTYKNISIKPGLSYRDAIYDDSQYATKPQGFLNGKQSLSNAAGSLRGEYKLLDDRLKFIAAGRLDKYNYTDKIYTSYQFGINYKLNDNNLLRLVYSKAYRGPNMYDIYNNQSISLPTGPSGPPISIYADILGNKKLQLLNINLFELGYRAKASQNLHFDIEAFYQMAQSFSLIAGDKAIFGPGSITTPLVSVNIPLTANQLGLTISANYVLKKFQFKPFVTIQQTQLTNVSQYRVTQNGDTSKNKNMNINTTYNTNDKSTPSFYGGFYSNYQATTKLNINLSAYFYGANSYNGIVSSFGTPGAGIVNNHAKVLLNAKISYKVVKQFDVFINVRNLLNQTSSEFVQTDKTNAMFLLGGSFEF